MRSTVRGVVVAGLSVMIPVVFVSSAAAQTRVKPGFNLFSTDQDVEIGRQSAIEIERQLPILKDRVAHDYVGAIGQRLAAVLPGAKFPYQFKVVNVSDINAFALPGGYMYVNRGLIEAAKNEGQLAGVLAHEMSHVALRHGTNQASKAYLGQTGLGLLGGLLTKDDGSPNKVIGALGGFGLNALFLKFSRTDEEQADVVGAQTLAKAGYDPQDMSDFFELLRSKQSGDPGKVQQFFSSHPAPQNRATRIRNETKLLTVQPTAPVGGFGNVKSKLTAMPAAGSMQAIAKNPPASAPPRTQRPGAAAVGAIADPSATVRAFVQRHRLFRIEYPSNWRVYESTNGMGVTIAPEGGVVEAGATEPDLIYGVVVNHYEPFLNDPDERPKGRSAFKGARRPSARGRSSLPGLDEATADLVGQIVRTNPTLKPISNARRPITIDGGSAMSVVLAGRSAVTGGEERVTVFTRDLPDDHIVYALFIAPAQSYGALEGTFTRMIRSLRVSDEADHP